jgi:hypothetical protein
MPLLASDDVCLKSFLTSANDRTHNAVVAGWAGQDSCKALSFHLELRAVSRPAQGPPWNRTTAILRGTIPLHAHLMNGMRVLTILADFLAASCAQS